MGFAILLFSIVVCATIGALVLSRGVRDKITYTYALLTFTLLVMSTANYLAVDTTSYQLLTVRLVMASSTVAIYLILLLVTSMRGGESFRRWRYYFLAATIGVVIIDVSPMLFSGIVAGAPPKPILGPAVAVYFIHFLVSLCIVVIELVRMGRRARNAKQSSQYRSLIFGIAPIIALAPLTSFVLPNLFNISNYVVLTPLYGVAFSIGVGYAVVRHGLFDVKRVAVRTVAYILSIFTMAAVYFGLAYIASTTLFSGTTTTGVSMSPINIALALILAFIFQPIKQFFDKVTNQIFYRDRYDTNTFLSRIGQVLTSTTKLHEVMSRSAHEIETTLKTNGSMFIVYRDHHPDAVSMTKLKNNFTETEYALIHDLALTVGCGVLMVSSLESNHAYDAQRLRMLLAKRNIALVLPLVTANEIIGYLLLGEQLAGNYTKRDIEVLETLADSLIIAIQNARSVQVVRDLNTHLEQRITAATKELRTSNKRLVELDATKDEFVSMASHQLRTPLTSIKGYLSMVLEGDVGRISPQQRQLLTEAFTSSERMVGLIGDFLNVSRLQTGKFMIDCRPTDLAKLVAQEVESIHQIADTHGVTIKYRQPAVFPTLYLDDNKLRQVVMNFIDNAIYYSPESRTPITLRLTVEDGYAVLRVIDKGMGVPAEVQRQLFTKFFRAENARRQRPDGTGVGLFLAKKVIDGHGGKIVFESSEGKGSTFGFRLPIKKLSTPPETDITENTP